MPEQALGLCLFDKENLLEKSIFLGGIFSQKTSIDLEYIKTNIMTLGTPKSPNGIEQQKQSCSCNWTFGNHEDPKIIVQTRPRHIGDPVPSGTVRFDQVVRLSCK